MKIKFRHFTKPQLLKRIRRDLLARFFAQFTNLALPPPSLPDAEYFDSLARLLLAPESLPERLTEARFAIDEMSTVRAQAQLEASPEWAELQPLLAPDSSPPEIALQIWLVAPALLARVHNAQRLRRLTTFEYFGSPSSSSSSFSFSALNALSDSLDRWVARNHRGHRTTRVELYPLDGEFWFLVRHGDVFTRTPKVEAQKTEILHFRPERDDVIVYSPEHEEIRINARTKGERELYREQFGLHLHGSADYFSRRETYTLEPLRADGPQALRAAELSGLTQIILREIEIAFDNGNHEVITTAADDLFDRSLQPRQPDPIPRDGRLARALFEVQFTGGVAPRAVEVRPPNILKLGRGCDAQLVQRWLSSRGFRIG